MSRSNPAAPMAAKVVADSPPRSKTTVARRSGPSSPRSSLARLAARGGPAGVASVRLRDMLALLASTPPRGDGLRRSGPVPGAQDGRSDKSDDGGSARMFEPPQMKSSLSARSRLVHALGSTAGAREQHGSVRADSGVHDLAHRRGGGAG